jgi:hypothetical protein
MFVVIVVGALCLATGLLTGSVVLLWLALGLGVVAAALFGRLMSSGRRARVAAAELEDSVEPAPVHEPEALVDGPASGTPAPASEAPSGGVTDLAPDEPHATAGTGADVPDVGARTTGDTPPGTVRVVPGRHRFHREDCRLLVGKPVEEIGLDEALEEGFTACTACMPNRVDESLGAA